MTRSGSWRSATVCNGDSSCLVAWGHAFRLVLNERGVRLTARARNDLTGANLASVATEYGVSERTAQRRLALAKYLSPELAIAVGRGRDVGRRGPPGRQAP